MALSDELAQIAVSALQKRADLNAIRDEFDNSAIQEKVLRQHAQRLEELAARRAANEDTSVGGYASTLAKRLMPVPHTGAEAAVRVPGMIAGGILGHQLGKSYEPLPAEGLERIFSPLDPNNASRVTDRMKALGAGAGAKKLTDSLRATPGSELAGALRKPLPFGKPSALRQRFVAQVGEGNMGKLQATIGNLIRQTAGEGEKTLGSKPYRWGGALGGALLGGAAVGIPFALRALLQKRKGGEAAVRARNQAGAATGKADSESSHREDLLNKLPAEQQ